MIGFREANKTIIFCSHSMYLINELCNNAIWLDKGRTRDYGRAPNVTSEYLAYLKEGTEEDKTETEPAISGRSPLPEVIIEDIGFRDDKGAEVDRFEQFSTMVFEARTRCNGPPLKGHLSIRIEKLDGRRIFATTTKLSGHEPMEFDGVQIFELVIPSIPLVGGKYRAKARVGDEHALRLIHEFAGEPFLIESDRPEVGMVWMKHQWRFPGTTIV